MALRTLGWAFSALALAAAPVVLAAAVQGPAGTPAQPRGPVEEGAELFRGYCAPCHGARGLGDGPVADALKSRPTNLTRLAVANKGAFPAQRIAMVLEFGVMVSAHGTTDMPTWGATFRAMGDETLVRRRVTALTRYLETIQTR